MMLIHSNGHSNKDYYQQQQSDSGCSYLNSGNHSNDDCYHQRNDKRSSTADSNSKRDETSIADSTMNDCEECSCKRKVEKQCTKTNDESNMPPGLGSGL